MKKIMQEINQRMGTKSKIVALVCTVAIVVLVGVMLTSQSKQPKMELVTEEFTIEYGEPISGDRQLYIKATKDVLNAAIFDDDMEFEKDKGYPKVGTYKMTVTYKEEKLTFKIVVKDTTAPEFVDFKDTLEVEQDSTEDLNAKFKAEDLSKVTIKIDMEKLDLTKPGEYRTTVTASDEYENETVKDIVIVVKEKAEEQEDSSDTTTDSQTSTGSNTDNSSGGSGGSSNDGGNTGTGGTGTTPSNPAPTEQIVQLTPTPFASQVFDNDIAAENWAWGIHENPTARKKFAEDHGYTGITNWYPTDIAFGYASTGEVVYVKYSIVWTFYK